MKTPNNAFRFFKILLAAVMITGAAVTSFAQVDQGELQKNLAPVQFINYEGPHARIETREQIRQIGVPLGRLIRGGAGRAGSSNRYFVIHSVSEPEGNKLDADIFGLGVDTGVDHVRNLRTIIQGYLQEAYGYSAKDAALLAEYVTIYNAVYRGDWDYFSSRYKTPVIASLSREKAGLSIRFDEWPGRTLILIPLGIGGLSSIDTSAISDNRVVEELRKEDDRGVEQRRDMVDLKEREATDAEQKAAVEREAVKEEEKKITEERKQVTEEKQSIAQERQQVKEEQEAGKTTETQTAQKNEELDQREAEADKKSDELDQREEELVLKRDEAQKQENFAEKKTAEAQQERESIAKDQQAIIDQGETPPGLIGIILASPDAVSGKLVRLDPATRQETRRSALDTVYARTLTFINGKVLAIAGENKGNGAVRLIDINSRSLEMAKQGDDDIHPGSLIWVNGGDIYAITANLSDGTLNLGRFNADLVLQAKSSVTVHPNATMNIQQGNLLTQRGDGSAVILDPAQLTEKGK
ncbi:MAG: hypothetical protein LBD48_05595 [Treponema sp.]|jgi:hypothetical protein|nr:hypothetical protein [Treponema sp.]